MPVQNQAIFNGRWVFFSAKNEIYCSVFEHQDIRKLDIQISSMLANCLAVNP